MAHSAPGRTALGLLLLLTPLAAPPATAQEPPPWERERVLPSCVALVPAEVSESVSDSSPQRSDRIRLFRIRPGFLTEPVGLDDDLPGDGAAPPPPPQPANAAESAPDWIQFSMGADNPYFDFRQQGDPGGLGFYRVNTQVQLLDTKRTGCALGLQAVTPAGIQYGGLDNGPTVLSPSLCLFHSLDEETALQGFVGKNVPVLNAAQGALQRNLQYGVAVQRSLSAEKADPLRNLYLYVGALGQYRTERDSTARLPATFEVLPGLHWKVADNWWMSGGVIVPVGTARPDANLWQFTCSFQF